MSYQDFFDYYETVENKVINQQQIVYTIVGNVDKFKNKIIARYQCLAEMGLGIKIEKLEEEANKLIITLENFNPLDYHDNDQTCLKLGDLVAKLHSLNKGHGNLTLDNVVINSTGELALLSPEYLYDLNNLNEEVNLFAINKYDLDLENSADLEIFNNIDYDRWTEQLFSGSYLISTLGSIIIIHN